MIRTIPIRAVGALLLLLMAAPTVGHTQSAAQYNRAAQAMQICASAMGATIPECAQLRGAVGAPVVSAGDTAAVANMVSGLFGRPAAPAPIAPALPATVPSGGGFLGMAAQAFSAAPQPAAPPPGSADYYGAAANATYLAGLNYRACVARVGATNQAGVQGCIAQMAAASTGTPAPGFTPPPAAPALPAGFPGSSVPAGFPQPGAAATAAALAPAAASAFSSLIGR
jgi:hypothetical protein